MELEINNTTDNYDYQNKDNIERNKTPLELLIFNVKKNYFSSNK